MASFDIGIRQPHMRSLVSAQNSPQRTACISQCWDLDSLRAMVLQHEASKVEENNSRLSSSFAQRTQSFLGSIWARL